MNVTLRQLRAFTGVYRTRSVTRAARELGITQSAASLLIQQLETQLGVKLFDRSTRSVQPTLAADEAFHAAERMLSDAQGLSRRMRDLAQARAGRVAFLASAGAASALMGTLQLSLAALASMSMSVWQTGTELPMAVIMMACGTSAWLLFFGGRAAGIAKSA